ncbi:hypothetical protein [Treponema zioleckii]|uniref:hypothetical protein n=1 Tax=Treponema zioleckii TaxID=331680 RepID=UPI00168B6016|nr:hypothetical protein [Treponema zioleckii]
MTNSLLLIDPQRDFCSPDGALYVPGAEKDAERLSNFIKANANKLDSIHTTMDCHPYFHIAHPCFWKDRNGNEVPPYTTITHKDFEDGVYVPSLTSLTPRVDEYLLSLESLGRYQLTILPPHGLLGSKGFALEEKVAEAINVWEKTKIGNVVDYIIKSSNPFTEHYSAIQAEVQDPTDGSTKTNYALIEKLRNADQIFVAGESLSHNIANTVKDLLIYIPPSKITLLRDCTSSAPNFEDSAEELIYDFEQRGITIADSSFRIS